MVGSRRLRRPPLSRQGSQTVTEPEDDSLSSSEPSMEPGYNESEFIRSSRCKGIGIVVMGLTGAGKSTFISQLAPGVRIGHSLESCTTTVNYYSCHATNGQEIWLIDTPGFDDTDKDNAKVLREIASFLCTFCHNNGLSIGGMIYFHRITDTRMSSSSLKSIRTFEYLCGESNFPAVYVVTTMWDAVKTDGAKAAAMKREDSLRSRYEFFGRLVAGGATFPLHEDAVTESLKIVDYLAARRIEVDLEVRREMRAETGVTLAQTSVGRFMQGDLEEKRRKYEAKMSELEVYRRAVADKVDTEERHGFENEANDYDDEDIVADYQEHERLIEQTGTNLAYLDVTYEQMIEESTTRLTQDGNTLKALEKKTKALKQKLDRLRLDTELKDEQLLDQAEMLKDRKKTIGDQDEAIRELEEKLSRTNNSKRDRKMFANMFTLPIARLISGPFAGPEKEALQKQQLVELPPSEPRVPRNREARVKSPSNPKRNRQRRPTRPDIRPLPSQDPQQIASHEQMVLNGVTDLTEYYQSPLNNITYTSEEHGHEHEEPSCSAPQHYISYDHTTSPANEVAYSRDLPQVTYGPIILPRKYESHNFEYKYA